MLIFNEIIKKPLKSYLNFLSYVENLKIAFDMFKTNQYQYHQYHIRKKNSFLI